MYFFSEINILSGRSKYIILIDTAKLYKYTLIN